MKRLTVLVVMILLSCGVAFCSSNSYYSEGSVEVDSSSKDLVVADQGSFHVLRDGTPAYPDRYDRVWDFRDELAMAKLDERYFHILEDGSPAYAERYDDVWYFVKDVLRLSLMGNGFIS
jgi:hypothetical protein